MAEDTFLFPFAGEGRKAFVPMARTEVDFRVFLTLDERVATGMFAPSECNIGDEPLEVLPRT